MSFPPGAVTVIGGGLAGCEAAWQLASQGVAVKLYEMRPLRSTKAHHTDRLAELVCSNSLGSVDGKSAPALLKNELARLDCKLLQVAWDCRVPAGHALAVDREAFAEQVTRLISDHPLISLSREEAPRLPESQVCVVATGPLTSDALAASLQEATGQEHLNFFDAASPILTRESIDLELTFAASRYSRGEGEYINCPMNRRQYLDFLEALMNAERAPLKDFERDTPYFEGCLPVEVIASRGKDTLRYGPLKPVGLVDPRTGRRPWAVVQLRQDNAAADLYNMVGFQTNLKWGEQQRVFKMIPGLANAEFVRLGVMHRNTYVNSPCVLEPTLQLKGRPNVFLAGQLTGVEGYTESIATGLVAGRNAARLARGEHPLTVSPATMIGALIRYITSACPASFQPINSNWGLLATPPEWMPLEKPERRRLLAERAQCEIETALKEPVVA